MWIPPKAISPLLVGGVSVLAGVLTFLALGSEHPTGTDGYYYVVQVESLIREGRLHVPDASWMLRFLAVVSWIAGDAILGIQIGIAVFAGLTSVSAYVLLRSIPEAAGMAWIGCAWVAASPSVVMLAAAFPKNLSVVPFVLFALAALSTIEHRGMSPARVIVLGVALLAAATGHRLGAVFGGFACLLYVARAHHLRRPLAMMALGGLIVFVGLTAIFPNLLHVTDWQRLTGQIDMPSGWPPPWGYHQLRGFALPHLIELSVAAAAVVIGIAKWRAVAGSSLRLFLAIATLIALFPGWRTDVLDVGYRLTLFAPIFGIPLCISYWAAAKPRRVAWVAVLLLVGAPFIAKTGYRPETDPPYRLYRQIVERIPRPLPSLLIAHQGLNFYYDHLTGHEAMAWAPDPSSPTDTKRVVYGVSEGDWLALLTQRPQLPWPVRLTETYWYVSEATFVALTGKAEQAGDTELLEVLHDWRNPLKQRPWMLLRNH